MSPQLPTLSDALSFVQVVKTAFKDEIPKFVEFMKVIIEYKNGRVGGPEVITKVHELLKGHPELTLGFSAFLLGNHGTTVSADEGNLPMESPIVFEQTIPSNYFDKVRARFLREEHVYIAFMRKMRLFAERKKSIHEVYEELKFLFVDHADLVEQFTFLLPSPEEEDGDQNIATNYFHKVRERFEGKESVYIAFSWKMSLFAEGKKSIHEVYEELKSLFVDHADLVEECTCLLSSNEEEDGERYKTVDETDERKNTDLDPLPRLRHKCRSAGRQAELIRQPSQGEQGEGVSRGLRESPLRKLHQHQCMDLDLHVEQNHGKESGTKPIFNLNFSDWAKCEGSKRYRLLAEIYPKLPSTHRTELEKEVLNDSWVCAADISERSFRNRYNNQYEEVLFQCEDYQFELDCLAERAAATVRKVAEALDFIQGLGSKNMSSFVLEDHLSTIHLRCIESIYGDQGLECIARARQNPANALPVILARLRQKHAEWSKCRKETNKKWADIYADNFRKALTTKIRVSPP